MWVERVRLKGLTQTYGEFAEATADRAAAAATVTPGDGGSADDQSDAERFPGYDSDSYFEVYDEMTKSTNEDGEMLVLNQLHYDLLKGKRVDVVARSFGLTELRHLMRKFWPGWLQGCSQRGHFHVIHHEVRQVLSVFTRSQQRSMAAFTRRTASPLALPHRSPSHPRCACRGRSRCSPRAAGARPPLSPPRARVWCARAPHCKPSCPIAPPAPPLPRAACAAADLDASLERRGRALCIPQTSTTTVRFRAHAAHELHGAAFRRATGAHRSQETSGVGLAR